MNDFSQIELRLQEFLRGHAADASGQEAPAATGVADHSLRRGLVDFIAHSWGVVVDESELAPQHLQSTACLARLVAAKVLGGGAGRAIHCREIDALRLAVNDTGVAD